MPDEPNFGVEPAAPEAPEPTPNPDPVVVPPESPPVVEEPELTVAEPAPEPVKPAEIEVMVEKETETTVEVPKPEPTVKVLGKLTTMSAEAVKELTEGFALAAKQSDVDAVMAGMAVLNQKCEAASAVAGNATDYTDSVEHLSDYAFAVFTKSGYGLRWSFVTQADKSINVEVHIVLKS